MLLDSGLLGLIYVLCIWRVPADVVCLLGITYLSVSCGLGPACDLHQVLGVL